MTDLERVSQYCDPYVKGIIDAHLREDEERETEQRRVVMSLYDDLASLRERLEGAERMLGLDADDLKAHLKEDAAFQNAYDDEVEHYRQVFHRQEADLLDVQKVAHANEQKYLNAMTELTALRNAVRQAVDKKYSTRRLRQLIEEKE